MAESLNGQIASLSGQIDRLERDLAELRTRLDSLKKEIITNARVVAATLTKCYVGDELEGQNFDAVIVDEISMALPPLLFVAGRRAVRRVVLVGDFKQLPPIIKGDSRLSNERLRQDAFHLAGLARNGEDSHHPAMARLRTQRRMLPGIADVAREISYGRYLRDHPDMATRPQPGWLGFLPSNPLVIVDTADLHCWSGRQAGSLSRFNLYSAQIAVELAAMAATQLPAQSDQKHQIGIVTPFAAQGRLLRTQIDGLKLDHLVKVGTIHTFQGGEAELIIFDSVLDLPYWTARICDPNQLAEVRRDLNVAVTRARSKFILLGSSEWLNRRARAASGLGRLWEFMKVHADLISAYDLVEAGFADRVAKNSADSYRVPLDDDTPVMEVLDEATFFARFESDLREASESLFGLVPYFGEYRWPRVEPHIRAALERGVEVTLITPPPSEAQNNLYVEAAIRSLRQKGAVVVASTGLHGKDIIIDSRIHYTGSLNWASHRGRAEIMHRAVNPKYAQIVLENLQMRHIRSAVQQDGIPRVCPECKGPVQVVNQTQRMATWDKQPVKLGCAHYQSTGCGYVVPIDQRPPFLEAPKCKADRLTKYRRVKRGRGEAWECPKHPKACERFKVVAGDPSGFGGRD